MLTKLTGVLRNLADIGYEFESDDGGRYPIPAHIAEGVQYNYRIWLDVRTGEWGRLEEEAGSPMLERKHVLLLRTCSPGTSEETRVRLLQEVLRYGRELELFYRFYCGDIWDVKVHADLVPTDEYPWQGNWCAGLHKAYLQEHTLFPTADFNPNYFHTWSHFSHGSWCGLGQVNNQYSWTQVSCGLHTIIHELGHNFGLHHATEGDREYGDKTCVMGAGGNNIPGLNAPHMAKLRRLARRPFASVDTSQWVVLAPMETNDHALFPSESVLAEVNRNGTRVWLSIRRKRGAQYDFGTPLENKVNIHTKTSDGKSQYHGYISEGEEKRLPNGVVATYALWDDNAATVWLGYDGDKPDYLTQPQLTDGFPLEHTPYEEWHDGLWYNPKVLGQGLAVVGGKHIWYGFDDGEVSSSIQPARWWGGFTEPDKCFTLLDRNNAIWLTNTATRGRDAIELKRLGGPTLYSKLSYNNGYTAVHFHFEPTPHEPFGQEVILLGEDGGTWYYLQDQRVYSMGGRHMQESYLKKEEVGTWDIVENILVVELNNGRTVIEVELNGG